MVIDEKGLNLAVQRAMLGVRFDETWDLTAIHERVGVGPDVTNVFDNTGAVVRANF
jgi:hypothetical protein